MDDNKNFYIGQIISTAGDLIPDGFLPCDGRLLETGDYPQLFALIGKVYGGDGERTFALPDLRVRIPVGIDERPEFPIKAGDKMGEINHFLKAENLPPHSHENVITSVADETEVTVTRPAFSPQVQVTTYDTTASEKFPNDAFLAGARLSTGAAVLRGYVTASSAGTSPVGKLAGVSSEEVSPQFVQGKASLRNVVLQKPTDFAGKGLPFAVVPPVLGINFYIAVTGEYPTTDRHYENTPAQP